MSGGNSMRRSVIYTLGALLIGWGGMAFYTALPNWWQAYQSSSLYRYEPLAGASQGPADFMIYHDDFNALEAMLSKEPELLSVDRGLLPGIGRVVFASPASALIAKLRQHPDTGFMISGTVAFICH